jgi:hypothetical protein
VREFRVKQQHVDGLYVTLDQAAFVTKGAQARLFGFEGEIKFSELRLDSVYGRDGKES